MQSRSFAFALLGSLVFSSPAVRADPSPVAPGIIHAASLMGGEHIGKIREEIRLHEARAREIEPILARDRQARHDVEADWIILERHAREMHARAKDFSAYASEVSGHAQNEMTNFANELESFAAHDDENARWQHEVAERLERAIKSEETTRDWHLKIAQRMKDWLVANGS